MQIYVVGKQWMWYVQHPGGQREINEVHVPVNRDVQFIITSQDVIHSFYMPAFRIKRDAVPGMYTTEWFRATRTGEFPLILRRVLRHEPFAHDRRRACDERGRVSSSGSPQARAASRWRRRARSCTSDWAASTATTWSRPALDGLYMKGVGLADGKVTLADDAYLRESILDPGAKIVAGFPNLMPSFQGVVTEEGILQLIAYIKSLGTPALAGPGAGRGAGQGTGPPPERPRPASAPSKA